MTSPLHTRIAHNYGLQSTAAPISPSASSVARAQQTNSSSGLLLRDHAAPLSPSAQARAQTITGHLTAAAGSSSYAALGSGYASPARASPNPSSPVGSPVGYAQSPSPAPAAGSKSPRQSRPALLAPMWTAAATSSAPISPSSSAAASSSSSAPLPYSTPVPVSASDPHLLIRRAQSSDYSKGHVTLLSQLTTVGAISAEEYTARWRLMSRHSELLHVLVIEDVSASTIIGSATLLIEPKFVHSCGFVGHIEDVVVSSGYRGKNLGHRLLSALHDLARLNGCYKIVLDCAESNKAFYEKIGYKEKERHMRLDL